MRILRVHRPVGKMTGEDLPLLVVVTGPPGAGKTTVARELAARLRLPLLAKDDVKETLFDALGWSDRDWSRRLGVATYALLFRLAGELLGAGAPLVLESNFLPEDAARLEALPPHRTAQVYCTADPELLLARYRTRQRHPGHVDDVAIAEAEPRIRAGAWTPLDLPGPLVELDTTREVDAEEVAKRILGP